MRSLVVLAMLAALAGCTDHVFRDCKIACTAESGCPDDFTCGREGFCRTASATAACPVMVDAKIDAPIDALVAEAIGNDTEFPNTSNISSGYLLGFRLTVPAPRTLLRLGAIGKVAGGNMKLALYTDSAGSPSSLVAATTAFQVIVGAREVSVPPKSLATGSYWLVAAFDTNGRVGMNAVATTMKYMTFSFSSAPPSVFGAVSTYNDTGTFNYWIVVQ